MDKWLVHSNEIGKTFYFHHKETEVMFTLYLDGKQSASICIDGKIFTIASMEDKKKDDNGVQDRS